MSCMNNFWGSWRGELLTVMTSVSCPCLLCILQAQRHPSFSPEPEGTCCQNTLLFCFVFNQKSSDLRKPVTCGFQRFRVSS